MPVYDAARFLDDAAPSALSPAFADSESIILNDGSADASEEILREYSRADSRVVVLERANRGLAPSPDRCIRAVMATSPSPRGCPG